MSRSELRSKLPDRPLEVGRHERLHLGISTAREHFVSLRLDRFDLFRRPHEIHYDDAG